MRLLGLIAALLCAAPALAQETGSERSYEPSAAATAKSTHRAKRAAKRKAAPVAAAAAADKPAPVAISSEFAEEYGWQVVDDAATGVRIGLPMKMVPVPREAKNGSLWASRHNTVRVETFKLSGTTLSALYDEERKNTRDRQIEYNVSRPDSFFIHGLNGLKLFSTRAFVKNGEIRGFTISYDQAMAGIVAPVGAAMASTFVAFPNTPGPAFAAGRSVDETNTK